MATQENIHYNCLQKYFSRFNNFTKKCNICSKLCSENYALMHLYKFHDIIDEEALLKWNNDNDVIWQYFSKKELFIAKCKFCGNSLTAYNKKNLQQHLKSQMHSQLIASKREEISRSWVSPHFKFGLDNYDIYCIHCEYSFIIFDRVDVLKYHLNNRHHINEDLGFHRKTENCNVDATTQQSITEGNNVAAVEFKIRRGKYYE